MDFLRYGGSVLTFLTSPFASLTLVHFSNILYHLGKIPGEKYNHGAGHGAPRRQDGGERHEGAAQDGHARRGRPRCAPHAPREPPDEAEAPGRGHFDRPI